MNFHRPFLTAFTLLGICLAGLQEPSAQAQDWVKAMFKETTHDFGTVARGAKAQFSFVLENKYEEDIHIASVRTTCTCTTPSIKDDSRTLKTYQKGEIVCKFNTDAFIGSKAAVVTVVFDKPVYGEMQLNVKGTIRSDVSTDPGEIQFGDVARGTEKSTSVKISYRGSRPWEIKDVRSENMNLGVQLSPKTNRAGVVEYDMKVRLKPSAPVGSFSDEIILVTNEANFNLVTIPVRGKVPPPLEMSDSVALGTTKVEEVLKSRLIVKGQSKFAITNITCEDPRFSFKTPSGSRTAHLIPLEFNAGKEAGAFRVEVTVETDLSEDNKVSTFVSGNVVN
ncbi:MAG: DUF1573 domain-containing protein [Planctomycetota bacterium]